MNIWLRSAHSRHEFIYKSFYPDKMSWNRWKQAENTSARRGSFSGHFSHNSNLQTESTVAAYEAANRVLLRVQNTDEATLPRETSAIIKAGKNTFILSPAMKTSTHTHTRKTRLKANIWLLCVGKPESEARRWGFRRSPWAPCEPELSCRAPWCCCCQSSELHHSLWWRLCTASLTGNTAPC